MTNEKKAYGFNSDGTIFSVNIISSENHGNYYNVYQDDCREYRYILPKEELFETENKAKRMYIIRVREKIALNQKKIEEINEKTLKLHKDLSDYLKRNSDLF